MLNLSISSFVAWLITHQHIAYIVLFLGAYSETLIGPSFFVPGEIFLISGSILAGAGVLNIFFVTGSLYVGAALGDSSSYYIGSKTGPSIFRPGQYIFSTDNYQKGEAFFKKFGNKAIFLARIMGPLSWITPFLAGIFKVPYPIFLKYNLTGIIVGIGQFMVIGYFFGNQYKTLIKYYGYVIIAAMAVYLIYLAFKHIKNKKNG